VPIENLPIETGSSRSSHGLYFSKAKSYDVYPLLLYLYINTNLPRSRTENKIRAGVALSQQLLNGVVCIVPKSRRSKFDVFRYRE
jgi:hypothetical protein